MYATFFIWLHHVLVFIYFNTHLMNLDIPLYTRKAYVMENILWMNWSKGCSQGQKTAFRQSHHIPLDYTQYLEFFYFIIKDNILGQMQSTSVPLHLRGDMHPMWYLELIRPMFCLFYPALCLKNLLRCLGSSFCLLWFFFIGHCSAGSGLWQMDHGSIGMTSWRFASVFLFLWSVVFVSTELDEFPKALAINVTHLIYQNLHKPCAVTQNIWQVVILADLCSQSLGLSYSNSISAMGCKYLSELKDLGHFLSEDRKVPKNHMFLSSELESPVWLQDFDSFSSDLCEGEGRIVSVAL